MSKSPEKKSTFFQKYFQQNRHLKKKHNSDHNYCHISTIIIFSLLTMLVLIRLTKRTH